jgi:hypothetical protein
VKNNINDRNIKKGKKHYIIVDDSPVETKDEVDIEIQHSNIFFRLSANRFKSVSSDGVELRGSGSGDGVDSLASLNILIVLKDSVEM